MFKTYKKLTESQLATIKKILIVQHKPFGDILLNTGYLPELRRKFPKAQIDYLIQRPYITVLEDNPHLDNLVIMEKREGIGYYLEQILIIFKIRKRKYDLIIDQLRGTSSARIVMCSGIKYRLGFNKKRWNKVYNVRVNSKEKRYHGRMKFDLLAPLGIDEVEHNLEYVVKQESYEFIESWLKSKNLIDEKIVLFSPGTPVKRKQWALENYALLGDLIHENTDFKIVIVWAPDEMDDVNHVKKLMRTEPVIAPATTFNQAAALLNYVSMLICNDGGITHVAVSQNTPTITIVCPTSDPLKWTAWHKDIHIYFRGEHVEGEKYHGFNVSAQQVFDKFLDFFKLRTKLS